MYVAPPHKHTRTQTLTTRVIMQCSSCDDGATPVAGTHKLIGRQRQLSTHEATLMVVGCQIVGDVDVTMQTIAVFMVLFFATCDFYTPLVLL